mmetsp:Transcript_8839/g.30801  ORF Transcript_8839/g.30801 Transcript_8839/m.30801 type:complete len:376 (+) Transcript_8839:333-1460(+)
MAKDLMPRMLPGFMLHTTTTRAPCITSMGTYLTRPLTTWRGAPSPTSISSTYSDSASGCFHTLVITPTRRSRRETSTGASAAGAAFFAGAGAPLPPPPPPPLPFLPPAAAPSFFSASIFVKSTSPTSTFVPGARFSKSSRSVQMGTGDVPSLQKISMAEVGMKGMRQCAQRYTASSVALTHAALSASTFMCHGALSVRNLLVVRTASSTSSAAVCIAHALNAVSTLCLSLAKSNTLAVGAAGTLPPHILPHRFAPRCTRLPRVSARSELIIPTRPSSLKLTSEPNVPFLTRKKRKASAGYLSSMAWGSTTLPRDLDIFCPSAAMTKPWAKTRSGTATPADMSIEGQITQWNHWMSLPIIWTSHGQKARVVEPARW